MCVRDFHLVGTVGNNEECSVISTNILMLVRLFLMDYSGLAVGWREAWCSRIRIRFLDRAIPILGLISQFPLICCYSLIAGVVCRFNFLSCNSFSLIVSGKGVYWARFSSNEIVDTRSMLRQKNNLRIQPWHTICWFLETLIVVDCRGTNVATLLVTTARGHCNHRHLPWLVILEGFI